jgi:hypothetical protein
MKQMESCLLEGERPVIESRAGSMGILSSTAHVKRRVNSRRPFRKAKYESATDSEQVPRGKGEKNRCERSEIEPETVCLQGVRASLWSDGVPFA